MSKLPCHMPPLSGDNFTYHTRYPLSIFEWLQNLLKWQKHAMFASKKKASAMNYHTSRTQYHLEGTDRQSSRHKVQLKRETRQQMRFSLSIETMPKDESRRSLITVIVIFFELSARIRKTRQEFTGR